MNHIKLTDSARSIRIQIPGFSKVVPKQTISYGSVPFLIFGRKWGLNVYPHGLRPSSKDYGQRIDIYVHIWAKDSNETEAQFKTWVRENNLHFNLVITEPEPAALYRVESSESLWCDMEDEAGWWLFSLRASSRLLELTNDTLIVEIQFQPGPSTNTVPAIGPSLLGFSPLSDQRKLLPHIKDVANKNLKFPDPVRFRPFPTPYDPSLEVFFNNQTFSDLVVVAQGREIHLQQCFVSQKLPNWASIHKDIHADLETTLATTAPQSPNTFESSTKPSKSSTRLLIDSPYQVLHALFSFAYSGTLALDPTPDSYAHLYVLSERYGMDTLRRYCKRELHALLCPDAAVSLLCSLGGRSPTLQEFIVAYIIHNFTDVMASDGFKRLFFGPRVRHSRRLLAILRRMETRITVGDDARAHAAVTVSNVAAAVGLVTSPASEFSAVGSKLDWRRSMAFRSLLTNPEVADVHFLVEGRYIYAQKSVLSALSDFFLAMFSRSWAESSSENGPTIIEIPDFPYSTFYNMLLFLYVHEIEPPKSMVDTGLLYVIADKYQLLDLVRHAEHLLVRQLTSNNAPEFLFGFAHRYEPLRRLATAFIVREFNDVRAAPGFWGVIRNPATYPEYSSILGEILNRVVVKGFVTAEIVDEEVGEETEEDEEECDVTAVDDDTVTSTSPPSIPQRTITPETSISDLRKCARHDSDDGTPRTQDSMLMRAVLSPPLIDTVFFNGEVARFKDEGHDNEEEVWMDPVDGSDAGSIVGGVTPSEVVAVMGQAGILFQNIEGHEVALPVE